MDHQRSISSAWRAGTLVLSAVAAASSVTGIAQPAYQVPGSPGAARVSGATATEGPAAAPVPAVPGGVAPAAVPPATTLGAPPAVPGVPAAVAPMPGVPQTMPAPGAPAPPLRTPFPSGPAQAAAPRPPLPPAPPAPPQEPVKGLPADAPKLVISGGVYSANRDQRMLIVNGQVVREGADLGSGVKVQEITPGGVVLAFRGTQYRVTY